MMLLCVPILMSAAVAPPPHPVERHLQESGLTGCQQCCTPGGSCEQAYHGEKGQCCGMEATTAFCCPWPPTTAMCVRCNIGFKCARAGAARSQADLNRICAGQGGAPGPVRGHGARPSDGSDMVGLIISLMFLGVVGFLVYRCCTMAASKQEQEVQMGAPPPYGATGAPGYPGQPYGAGYGQPGYGGGGGANVALAGGAGLLGGMLVGEALAGGHGGGYGGGGYGGGGYEGGGGDFGGGDAGFSADS